MRADVLVETYGDALIGRCVVTPEYGNYPGGKATVVSVQSGQNPAGVVFDVKHHTEGIIWIFDYEDVELLPE